MKPTPLYPHAGGCPCCRARRVCNWCGQTRHAGCTNGRCGECCNNVCTGGGSTSPGHGYYRTEEQAALAAAKGGA